MRNRGASNSVSMFVRISEERRNCIQRREKERKREGKDCGQKKNEAKKKKCDQKERKWRGKEEKQDRRSTCNVTLRHLRVIIVAVEKQLVLRILSECL